MYLTPIPRPRPIPKSMLTVTSCQFAGERFRRCNSIEFRVGGRREAFKLSSLLFACTWVSKLNFLNNVVATLTFNFKSYLPRPRIHPRDIFYNTFLQGGSTTVCTNVDHRKRRRQYRSPSWKRIQIRIVLLKVLKKRRPVYKGGRYTKAAGIQRKCVFLMVESLTHLFKQSKPEQEKSNQSETEHLVLSKELINVNWRTTDEARNVNFQNLCTVANSHLSTPLIEPNFYVQLPHRGGSTVSLETIPFRNRLCRHPRHNFSADTQEVLRGLTLLVV